MVSVFPEGAAPASAHAEPANANENATRAVAPKMRKNMASPSGKATRSLHESRTGQGASLVWPCSSQRVLSLPSPEYELPEALPFTVR
jgi:hypothetical protein